MAIHIGRREVLCTRGGAMVALPLAARAQQPATPVVGFLRDATPAGSGFMVDGLRKGLAEAGFVEGHNLTIDYACTEGQSVRLSTLAELVGRHVPVIVSSLSTRRLRPSRRPPRSPLYSRPTTIRWHLGSVQPSP
jgi:putative tryptophan/tyrosine transport system substrate-binding protein